MSVPLPPAVRALLAAEASIKLLVTLDEAGVPRPWVATYLHACRDGTLHYLVVEEGSIANKSLVRSIWFDQRLAIILIGGDGQSLIIQGKVARNHFTGPIFLDHYLRLRDTTGEDLASLWEIIPEEIGDGRGLEGRTPVEGAYSVLHFDRIARQMAG